MEGTSVIAGFLSWILLALIVWLPVAIAFGVVLVLLFFALALALAFLFIPLAVVALIVILLVRGVKKSKQKKASLDKPSDL